MRSCMFSFSGRSVDPMVYIIYFLLFIATLLGVSQRGGSSSLLYPAKTGTIGCPPILFIFTRCISTPWIFTFTSFSAMSDTEIYSRDPLLSCGSFFLCCLWRFQRSLWSGKRIFLIASAQAGVSVPYDLIRDLCIVAGFLSDLPIVWRCVFLGDLYRPKVLPGSWGISDVLGGTVLLSLACPGKSSPSLLLSSSLDE